jgi:hypothetical protein
MRNLKHPRTLNEAFGPYTSTEFDEPPADYPLSWWALMVAIALVTVALIVVNTFIPA